MNQKFIFKKYRWNKKLFNWRNESPNELISEKHKNVCRVLNYIDDSLIMISTITGCVSMSAFASLVGIPIEITSSTIGLKTCVITSRMKTHKPKN